MAGDASAFGRLYERHLPAIHRYVCLQVGDVDVAMDLVHDVFVRALEALPTLRRPERVRGWLLRCAHNRLANHWRHRDRHPVAEPAPPSHADRDGGAMDDTDRGVLENHVELALIATAMRDLTPAQREVLALRFGLDLSVSEAAAVMGRSRSAVKNLQLAALGRFRRVLEAAAPPPASGPRTERQGESA